MGNSVLLEAESLQVARWVKWLYGQPFVDDDATRECGCIAEDLMSIVDLYVFATEYDDCQCVNACLDAIRDLLVEKYDDVGMPLETLLPVLKSDCDEATEMIVDCFAYGPGAGSHLADWLYGLDHAYWHDPIPEEFCKKLCVAQAVMFAAHTSGKSRYIPDLMAAHAYHVCKPGEKLCCGRVEEKPETEGVELVSKSKKRKVDDDST